VEEAVAEAIPDHRKVQETDHESMHGIGKMGLVRLLVSEVGCLRADRE
jgi:hypothetical protein